MHMARPARPCVLVVEDEAIIALMTQSTLEDLGCEVIGIAHSVSHAMVMIQANLHRLDIVALDINLNGESAAPLAALLETKGIPFIITTGYDKAEFLTMYAGRPVLHKPYLAEHMAKTLTPLLLTSKQQFIR